MQSGKHFSREGYSQKVFPGSDSESIVFLRQRYTKKPRLCIEYVVRQ